MSQLSKQALKVENNTSFPNNNTNYITPAILRDYNVDIIDSMVDEIPFGEYTQSVDNSIASLNAFTASASGLSTGSLLVTASAAGNTITFTKGDASTFNVSIATGSSSDLTQLNQATASLQAFTASAQVSITNLNSTTASLNTSVSNLNTFTSSQLSINSGYNSYTQSANGRLNNLEAQTSSYAISASVAAVDAAQQAQINSLIAATASFVTEAESGSFLITASFDNGTRNLTFTKGNATTFAVNIPDVSGSSGNFVTTASFNAYTSSNDQRVSSLEANTASVATSITNLNSATSSLFTSASLGLVTASISGVNLTFTKGDGTQFTLQTATGSVVSASYAETSSIARNVVITARNGNASTLPIGTVVHITSAVGDNPIFNTASYDTELLSSNTLGILRQAATSGTDVEVVVQGTVTGINTDPALGFAAGDVLYLSSSGQFTNIQPQAPNQIVTLGQVLRAQQNNGSMYVSINNGWELNELHNVQITSPQTNELLAYESASYGLWKNKSISTLGLATTGSNIFNGNQTINGAISASGDITGQALYLNDSINNGKIRFATGSGYFNIQLIPNDGDLAFSRDGVSNTKVMTLGGSAGKNTTFQNNPVWFESTIGSATFDAPVVINSGINSSVQITGSAIISSGLTAASATINGAASVGGNLTVTPLSLSTNAWYILPFISGGVVSKDSVDTLFYNPSQNVLQVSASATGVSNFGPSAISVVSGSGTTSYASSISKTSIVSSIEGYNIGMSGNPSKIGAPSLASNTKPALFALSSSNVPYVAMELEPSQSFTDGRVTFPRNVAMLQNLEITGSLTASLSNGYVWVGNANNKTTLVATSSFGTTINTGSFATTGSNTFTGNQTINANLIANKVSVYDFDSIYYGSQLGGTTSNGTFFGYGSTDYSFILGAYAAGFDSELKINADNTGITFGDFNGTAYPSFLKLLPNTGANPKPIMTRGLEVTGSTEVGTFTASLQQGYVWVGASNGRTTTVPTSSFGGGGAAFPYTGNAQISGSLGVTGSINGFVNALTISSQTASLDFNSGNFFTLQLVSGSTTHLTATNIKPGQTINLLVKTDSGSAAASGSLTFSPTFKFAGGFDYTPTAVTASQDLVSFVTFDTTQIFAAQVKNLS